MRYKWGAIPHEYLWWKCTIVVPWDLIPLCWPLFSIFKLVATELPELLIILPCTDSRKSWICTCQAASDELGMLIIQKLGMSFGKRTVKTTTVFFNYWSIYLCICVNSFWTVPWKSWKVLLPQSTGQVVNTWLDILRVQAISKHNCGFRSQGDPLPNAGVGTLAFCFALANLVLARGYGMYIHTAGCAVTLHSILSTSTWTFCPCCKPV